MSALPALPWPATLFAAPGGTCGGMTKQSPLMETLLMPLTQPHATERSSPKQGATTLDPVHRMLAAVRIAGQCLNVADAPFATRWRVPREDGLEAYFSEPIGNHLQTRGLIVRHPKERPDSTASAVRFVPVEKLATVPSVAAKVGALSEGMTISPKQPPTKVHSFSPKPKLAATPTPQTEKRDAERSAARHAAWKARQASRNAEDLANAQPKWETIPDGANPWAAPRVRTPVTFHQKEDFVVMAVRTHAALVRIGSAWETTPGSIRQPILECAHEIEGLLLRDVSRRGRDEERHRRKERNRHFETDLDALGGHRPKRTAP